MTTIPRRRPTLRREEIIQALDDQTNAIMEMVARWGDGIPPEVRAELLDKLNPAFEVLVKLGKR